MTSTDAPETPQTRPHAHHENATHGHGHGDDATMRHAFDDVARWTKVFDDPERDAWQQPEALVRALKLAPAQVVADIGAGTGYFERYLAASVGAGGTVLAVDIEPNLVAHIRDRAEKEATPRVIPVLASADNPRLPLGVVDLVLIVNTYHHIDARRRYFGDLALSLAVGGRIAIVDFKEGELPVGPPPEHKLAKAKVLEEMTAIGYVLADDHDFLPHQYYLVFGRASDAASRPHAEP